MTASRIGLVVLIALVVLLILPNARSLYEGIFFYLRDSFGYKPDAVQPISRNGRYASVYDLIGFRNVERYNYILSHLALPGLNVVRIPIPNASLPNILVRFSPEGPYTVYSAHFDKLHDDATYQGASDNTAADSVLLASIDELVKRGYQGSAAFLFTSEEETGLRGATAFVEYARANGISIRENINFDNLGRGKLAIRPSVEIPGYVFSIPFVGDMTFDGRQIRQSNSYSLANARLTRELLRVQPDIVVYQRFTARSDSNVFQDNGIDTVAISGDDMHYLELTWHTYADRVELLDERNLDRAFELILGNVMSGR